MLWILDVIAETLTTLTENKGKSKRRKGKVRDELFIIRLRVEQIHIEGRWVEMF